MTQEPGHEAAHEELGHVVPVKLLVGVLLALLFLTWLTVAASDVHLGNMNVWIALGIACVKGSLVVLFFMHMRWERPFNAILMISALVLMGLFISLALLDTVQYNDAVDQGDAKQVQILLEQGSSGLEAPAASGH